MELYKVPRNSKIRLKTEDDEIILTFSHLDGMYSLCYNSKGEIVHLAAWAEVEVVE